MLITGIARVLFPEKADGSLLYKNNAVIGSTLIGQQFDTATYFSSRPSVGSYNPLPSGGSNYGLTNTKLKDLVAARKKPFIAFNRLDSNTAVPSEMLFSSASGLDPHISPEAALLQVERVAEARKFTETNRQLILKYIKELTEDPQVLFLGEERINVLLLKLKLDEIE